MATLTITKAKKLIQQPFDKWEGDCFGIAQKLAPHVKGVAVYGHWLGSVNPDGYWAKRSGFGFQQHGWIVVPAGGTKETIIDPTRWSFEAVKPYIWEGANDGTYDEGGNKYRMLTLCGIDDLPDGEEIAFELLSQESYAHVGALIGSTFDASDYFVSSQRIRWLAHVAPETIGWWVVAEVYEAIIAAGMIACIPIDNLRMVHRRFKLRNLPKAYR